jgi:hypothetical protein
MLPAKFGSIWPSSFRGEDFFGMDTVDGYDSSTMNQIGMTILFFLFFSFF